MAETSESRASSSLSFHLTDFSGALPWDSFNSWNSFQGLLTNANQLSECRPPPAALPCSLALTSCLLTAPSEVAAWLGQPGIPEEVLKALIYLSASRYPSPESGFLGLSCSLVADVHPHSHPEGTQRTG